MNKLLEISLGIVTSVGGYLEIGSIATSAQAGAAFGFQLLWALVLGTLCIIVLVEMSGRFAAVSHHTISDRHTRAFRLQLLPLAADRYRFAQSDGAVGRNRRRCGCGRVCN